MRIENLTDAQEEILKREIPKLLANIIDFEKEEFLDYEINLWDGDLVKARLAKQTQDEEGNIVEDKLIFSTAFEKTEEGDLI